METYCPICCYWMPLKYFTIQDRFRIRCFQCLPLNRRVGSGEAYVNYVLDYCERYQFWARKLDTTDAVGGGTGLPKAKPVGHSPMTISRGEYRKRLEIESRHGGVVMPLEHKQRVADLIEAYRPKIDLVREWLRTYGEEPDIDESPVESLITE